MESTIEPTNLSTLDNEYLDQYEMYLLWRRLNMFSMVAYSLVFVLGTIGNGLVIFITGFRMKKTVNTIWILNLAIADFTFTFFLPLNIVHLSLEFHWPFGHVLCKFHNTLGFLNLYASVYLLVVISLDRCLSVWWPILARTYRTLRMASSVVLGVWILALVLCSPNLYFRDSYYDNVANKTYCFSSYGMIDEGGKSTHYAVVIGRFVLAFIIPFSVIAVCYGAIVWKLRRDRLARSNKPFKVITAVIVAFFVCWVPFHVLCFLEVERETQGPLVLLVGLPLTSCLACFNSCLNPILYVFIGRKFQDRLRRSFLSIFENAFTEEGSQANRRSTARSSSEGESNYLSGEK